MSGNFGYELDLTRFNDQEKEIVRQQVTGYKQLGNLIQTGDLYRLRSPFEGNESADVCVRGSERSGRVLLQDLG
jgi:alpha-galactosidase